MWTSWPALLAVLGTGQLLLEPQTGSLCSQNPLASAV